MNLGLLFEVILANLASRIGNSTAGCFFRKVKLVFRVVMPCGAVRLPWNQKILPWGHIFLPWNLKFLPWSVVFLPWMLSSSTYQSLPPNCPSRSKPATFAEMFKNQLTLYYFIYTFMKNRGAGICSGNDTRWNGCSPPPHSTLMED